MTDAQLANQLLYNDIQQVNSTNYMPFPKQNQGLQNQGNTCFMNAAMQNMFSAQNFRKHVILHSHRYPFDQFTNLIGRIFQSMEGDTAIDRQELLEQLMYEFEKIDNSYTAGSQHDARPFIFNFLDKLKCQNLQFKEYFKVQFEEACSTGNLQCQKVTLEDVFILNERQKCIQCSAPTEIRILVPSEYLILIKGNNKINEEVTYCNQKHGTTKYSAVSNCVYYGSGWSGHYVSNRRSIGDVWKNYNDSHVTTNLIPFQKGDILFGIYELQEKQQIKETKVQGSKIQGSFININPNEDFLKNQTYSVFIQSLFKKQENGAIRRVLRQLYFKIVDSKDKSEIQVEVINQIHYYYAKQFYPLRNTSKLLDVCYQIQTHLLIQALMAYENEQTIKDFIRKENKNKFKDFKCAQNYRKLNEKGCPMIKISAQPSQAKTTKPISQSTENRKIKQEIKHKIETPSQLIEDKKLQDNNKGQVKNMRLKDTANHKIYYPLEIYLKQNNGDVTLIKNQNTNLIRTVNSKTVSSQFRDGILYIYKPASQGYHFKISK